MVKAYTYFIAYVVYSGYGVSFDNTVLDFGWKLDDDIRIRNLEQELVKTIEKDYTEENPLEHVAVINLILLQEEQIKKNKDK